MFLEGRGDFSAGRSTLCRNGSKARFEVSCPRVERGDDSTCDLFLRVVYIDLLATITVLFSYVSYPIFRRRQGCGDVCTGSLW